MKPAKKWAVLWVALVCMLGTARGGEAGRPDKPLGLTVCTRDDQSRLKEQRITLQPAKTAVVVIDMWDRHWCRTYTDRVGNMVPRMNRTLEAARRLGMQVVFAPSDVLGFYGDAPQRKAMQAVPRQPLPPTVAFDPPGPPGPTDCCECGPDQPCKKESFGRWSRQHPGLVIAEGDLLGDCNNGRELLDLCTHRGIDTLLYMGVASNMCVQYRSMGIRNMKRHGLRAVVVADLVNAISANGLGPRGKPDRNFTPAKGSARVLSHIEQHVAPTLQSRQLIAAAGLDRFAGDQRPRVVFVIAEGEYDSARTLPEFAKKHLQNDYRCTILNAKADQGPGRNDVPGLETLYDADLLVLSIRRRTLPVVQMDHLERYIRSGRPIVAVRVSIVPFQVADRPAGHVVWDRFDKEVIGCDYAGYDSRSRATGCDVWALPAAAGHPIVKGLAGKRFHSPSWIYRQRPLAETAVPLLMGRWSPQGPEEPVAWTNTYRGARVFYTTLGHPDDFNLEPFNQLLLGGIRWALGGPGS